MAAYDNLWHASKSGLKGRPAPISRETCDFGKGWYLGDNFDRACKLVADFPSHKIYSCRLDPLELNVISLESPIKWAMVLAYYRDYIPNARHREVIYEKYILPINSCDLVIGMVAADNMYEALVDFFRGLITDQCLINIAYKQNLGIQYVCKTRKACESVDYKPYNDLINWEATTKQKISDEARASSISERFRLKFRRSGQFFDELLEEL